MNVPLQAYSGDASWLASLRTVVPALAEAFRPTLLVSQHGCDSHALDPLAHLRLTTAAYAEATGLLDEVAHRYCDGRWVATGGGGYDAYRVVPRSWSIVWLAQAHRSVPAETDSVWHGRWAAEAARYRQAPPPSEFIDDPDVVGPEPAGLFEANQKTVQRALSGTLEALASAAG